MGRVEGIYFCFTDVETKAQESEVACSLQSCRLPSQGGNTGVLFQDPESFFPHPAPDIYMYIVYTLPVTDFCFPNRDYISVNLASLVIMRESPA